MAMSSQPDTPVVFQPERTHLLGAVMMFGICALMLGSLPSWLWPLIILPVVFGVWVVRTRTTVSEEGITAQPAFRAATTRTWGDIEGIGFRQSRAFMRTTAGEEITLPGVSFNSLPQLEEASHGRIPDALTQGRDAADDKVVIVHKDGRQVLVSKDEYEASQENNKES